LGLAALLAGTAMALSACDGGSASTAARDHTQAQAAPDTTVADTGGGRSVLNDRDNYADRSGGDRQDARRQPVALVMGKPMWAANRQHSAEENAQYQFARDGADFDAKTLDDFVAKAHAFTSSPPHDVQTLTRSNGDKLLYDPEHNVFAVVSKEGAPRAMFKPTQGKAYWDEQMQRQAQGDDGGGRSRYSDRSRGGSGSGGSDNGDGDGQG
jgi:pyocin large subunit-like protein